MGHEVGVEFTWLFVVPLLIDRRYLTAHNYSCGEVDLLRHEFEEFIA
jgi:hypothetical protein